MSDGSWQDSNHVSLVEVLDRVLNKGAVITGEITISVADIDLVNLALQLVLASATSLVDEEELVVTEPDRVVEDQDD